MHIEYKKGECTRCGNHRLIVQKRLGLCDYCNKVRLLEKRKEKKKNIGVKKVSDKGKDVIKKDEKTYEVVWNTRPHHCEECGQYLGDRFRDDNGRVIDRFRYSHILNKKTYPELRHNVMNFNLLCLKHHNQWENPSTRKNMKIFIKNKPIIKKLKKVSNEHYSR